MHNVKIDETKVTKLENGKWLFDSHFQTEMDKEDYDSIINKLKNQIKTIEQTVKKNNPEKKVKNEIEKLRQQHKIDKEAYKNYDKYVQEEIDEILKNKEDKKKQLKDKIDNHNKITEMIIKNTRTRAEAYIHDFDFQLEKDKEMLKKYLEAE